MHKLRFLLLMMMAVLFVAVDAAASHPLALVGMAQQNTDATALATGGTSNSTSVQLTGTSDPSTCGGTYNMQFEVLPLSTPFTGTPNFTGPTMAKGTCAATQYPFATIGPLGGGTYHWQARENIGGTGTGPYTQFNGGGAAFIIGFGASPSAVTFGPQNVGTTSAPVSVALSNGTASAVTVSAQAVTSQFNSSLVVPVSVAAGATVNFNVTFSPTAAGVVSGNILLTNNSVNNPTIITLSGTGVSSTATLSPNPVAFGNRAINTTSPTQNAVITNSGTGPVTVTAYAISGTNAANFAFAGAPALPLTIAAGGTANLPITFTPNAHGARTATVTVTSNATSGGTSTTTALTGSGTGSTIGASPNPVAFGSTNTGTAVTQNLTISNTGETSLLVTAAAFSGANAGDFTNTTTLPLTVAAGATGTMTLSFNPAAVGARAGVVTLTSNDPLLPTVAVNLTGTGVSPAFAIAPNPQAFGNQRLGTTSAPVTVTISNTGSSALVITAATTTGAFPNTMTVPRTILAGATSTFTVSFAPITAGANAGSIVFTSNAPGSPTTLQLSGTGQNSTATPTPNPVAFGNRAINTTSPTSNVTITNSGNVAVSITGLALSGTNANNFALAPAPTLPASIAAGGTLNVPVTFTPSAHGARTATLTITSDATAGTTTTTTLTGSGTGSTIGATPNPVAFGSTNTGTPVSQTLTVSNTGETALTITAAVFSGANASDFTTTSTFPLTVAAGASGSRTITFNPSAVGARTGVVTLASNDPLTPNYSVNLTGTGTSPVIAVAPAAVAFGNQRVNTTSAVSTVTVSNTGTSTLTITAAALGGADSARFNLAAVVLPINIAPAGNATLSLTYSPTALGANAATLSLTSNDPVNGNVSVPLTGSGVAPTIAVAPSTIAFGANVVNRTSAAQTVTISNTGTDLLTVSDITIGGANAAMFALVTPPTLPVTVAAGATQTLSVTYTPTAVGAHTATLAIVSDDANALTSNVTLTGTGASELLTVTPLTLDFGASKAPSAAKSLTFDIKNVGGDPLTLVAVVLGGAGASAYTVTNVAGVLAPGATKTATVTFTAAMAGDFDGTAKVATTDVAVPTATVTLKGKGLSALLAVNPATLTFADQAVGTTSVTQTVTVTNQSSSAVTLGSVTSDDAAFVVAGADTTTAVASGATTTFTVAFKPSAAGAKSAKVNITLMGGTTPEAFVTVTGNGTGGTTTDDGGVAGNDSGVVTPPGTTKDAGATLPVGSSDAGADGGLGAVPAIDSGCGCRTTETSPSSFGSIGLAVLGLLFLGRRRRRS